MKIGLTPSEAQLIDEGRMLYAIRDIRVRLGCGLVEAKLACEHYVRTNELESDLAERQSADLFSRVHRAADDIMRQLRMNGYDYWPAKHALADALESMAKVLRQGGDPQ